MSSSEAEYSDEHQEGNFDDQSDADVVDEGTEHESSELSSDEFDDQGIDDFVEIEQVPLRERASRIISERSQAASDPAAGSSSNDLNVAFLESGSGLQFEDASPSKQQAASVASATRSFAKLRKIRQRYSENNHDSPPSPS